MIILPITKGYSAIIDESNYALLSQYRWYACQNHKNGNIYVNATVWVAKGKRKTISMHRLITGAKENEIVDHINGNSLDNRRDNLRIASHRINSINKRVKRTSSSKYKGVTWDKKQKKWRANVVPNGRTIHLGSHDSEKAAALDYDAAAIKYFGEFARLNFPRVGRAV